MGMKSRQSPVTPLGHTFVFFIDSWKANKHFSPTIQSTDAKYSDGPDLDRGDPRRLQLHSRFFELFFSELTLINVNYIASMTNSF
jgi:hypothetical protein